jgi:hypothetical protein
MFGTVNAAPTTVLLFHAKTQDARAVETDLRLAGLTVVSVSDPRKLLESARGRAVAALVVPREGILGPFWRRWTSDPDLRRIPVVVFAARHPRRLSMAWPLGVFIRADGYVGAAEFARPGAVAEAVRAVAARGRGGPPTGRQKLGEALWYLGSALYDLGLLLALVAVIQTVMLRPPVAIVVSAASLIIGDVLMALGGSVGVDERVRLRWSSWIWLAVLILVLALTVWARR